MDLRDLRYFEVTATLGHVREAAKQVHLTQPAVTKSIRRLEAELGVVLFEHIGRRIKLTEAGAVLLRRALFMRQSAEETTRQLGDLRSGAAGHVRVGGSATALEFILPKLTKIIVNESPEMTLDVVVGMNDALCAALKAGELDLALCPIVEADEELSVSVIGNDPVVVVASREHPLFGQAAIKLSDLCRHRWVLPADSIGSRVFLDGVFARRRLPKPVAQIRSASISLTPRLVAGTSLLSFISRRNLSMERVGISLREIPLRETVMQREFALLWRANAYLSPAVRRVRALIESRARKMLDDQPALRSGGRTGQRDRNARL